MRSSPHLAVVHVSDQAQPGMQADNAGPPIVELPAGVQRCIDDHQKGVQGNLEMV